MGEKLHLLAALHVFAAFALVGCRWGHEFAAPPDPRARPAVTLVSPLPPHTGRICVVRPQMLPTGIVVAVRDNGRLVGATEASTWFCWLAEPGEHHVHSHAYGYGDLGPGPTTQIRLSAGQTFTIEQELYESTLSHLYVPNAEAQSWIDQYALAYRVLVKAKAGDPIPAPETVVPARP